ncbi:hypothetical protein SIAM614_06863 [Roseibium aggregatum IAM 12614]|uniref:Uncharacterized protein n=1 Tax=Roseibium aggregatum (strain ATCC 25650 / DSM 13394 / JCM 20685 / NBRC 16684 / NCIMB 2208 / IAM 12614 / B1) TaxID=384765 RepID=A0NQZ8_ROSAI|nr:hypothetical protein [Roseibium aggregatum]EAV44579.1 hypothetical protein SIAM614_06863 [Roseibium aggregatum IAM 12614]
MSRIYQTAVLAAGLLAGTAFAATGVAKTVQVETIPVAPSEPSNAPAIPADDLTLPEAEESEDAEPAAAEEAQTPANDSAELPQVLYSTSYLPKPVQRMQAQLKEAALSGNMERLRMVFESNELPPTVSFGHIDDPIDFLKESSGDGEGFEILAILADIMDAGFLHVDAGTPQEMYVWPYFARYPLHDLTPDQKVEMFRIVTAGDYAEMKDFGAWTFYRVGIGPDGTLHYFVAGD